MEQSLLPCFAHLTELEREVADILLDLPDMIAEFESRPRLRVHWGCKRKRSAIDANDDNNNDVVPTAVVRFRLPSSSSLTNGPLAAVKVETSSPDTPFTFSPSESDERPIQMRKKVLAKRKREEWVEIIDELTQHKEMLNKEIQKVKRYYQKLNSFNSLLKARKEELISLTLKPEEPQLEIDPSLNLSMQLGQPTFAGNQEHYHHHHHQFPLNMLHRRQLFIMHQTAQRPELSENFGFPSNYTQVPSISSAQLNRVNNNNVGPVGVPDLNLCVEESIGMVSSQPFDISLYSKSLSKAMRAQARQNRLQIWRVKKSRKPRNNNLFR